MVRVRTTITYSAVTGINHSPPPSYTKRTIATSLYEDDSGTSCYESFRRKKRSPSEIDADPMDLDSIASALFRRDLKACTSYSSTNLSDDLTSRWDYVHDFVTAGPCLDSPVQEEPHTSVVPNQVEVSFDGSTNTIVSTGVEVSIDRVKHIQQKQQQRYRRSSYYSRKGGYRAALRKLRSSAYV